MNQNLNGKKVKAIFLGDNTKITSDEDRRLTFSNTYHGDRDEHWVLESVKGKEIARHNCKYIATINWEI